MTAPYLGGMAFVSAQWVNVRALRVRFDSIYGSDYHYQLYAGRSLAGVTGAVTDREILGDVFDGDWPQHLQLLAVDPAERLTDYGALLPPRPYNRVKLGFTLGAYAAAGAKFYEISAGTEPGGLVDVGNVLAREIFDFNGAHSFLTDPLEGSGTWAFEVAGIDGTLPSGNRGTALALSADVLAHPPDVAVQSDGSRFSLETTGGVLTVSFADP